MKSRARAGAGASAVAVSVGVSLASVAIAACGPAAAPGVDAAAVVLAAQCDKRCACEHCHADERGLCATDAKNTPALARARHCDAALDAWIACEKTTAACLGDKWIDEGCEKQHAAMLACTGR